jgi:hypothetical protein
MAGTGSWRYVLADLAGRSLGELRGYQRQFMAGISTTSTASCQIRQDDPLWAQVAAGNSKLKVYDTGGNLQLYGPVISDEETADATQAGGAMVTLIAADQSWELSKRFFAKDQTGVGTTYTTTDSGVIALAILAVANADRATGITAGNTGTFVQRTVTYLWKQALQAITELGSLQSSYEWGLRYVDASASAPTVYLDLAARMGTDRTGSVFLEYGTGKLNVQGYSKARSIDQQATNVYALGSGSTLVAQSTDAGAESMYAARREDVVSYGDISVASLLQGLASAHVAIRKDPYSTVRLTTFPVNAPSYGVDYHLGDSLTARVVVNNVTRVNGSVRVWGVQIAIDELGNETPNLVLTPTAGLP